ncbi:MAG: NADH-quinone oxidoreductase subunit NuoE, partial [Syntrophales bacterium]|nr:NADH-quinone oxidoreductase subunit NuoE [Syntrophales bacterium]
MLSPEEKQAIIEELSHVDDLQSASLQALKIVQHFRCFVSDEAIRDMAPLLGMTAAELDGVATFYPFIFRKPVGRNLILLCDSVTCWIMGYETILDYLQERLGIGFGETTADGQFTLLPANCIGACDHAPAIMINGKLYGDLNLQK